MSSMFIATKPDISIGMYNVQIIYFDLLSNSNGQMKSRLLVIKQKIDYLKPIY